VSIRPRSVLARYVAAAGGAGAAAGALLGWAGEGLSTEARAAGATGLALVAIGLGVAGLGGQLLRPLQCDRETPKRWVYQGPVLWPLKNGVALGLGAASRLGFPLWFVIPAGCLLTGSAVFGAALYSMYGVARTGAAGVIWLFAKRADDFDPILDWVRNQHGHARLVATSYLLLLGSCTLVVAGL
jgi:hypothetical protein